MVSGQITSSTPGQSTVFAPPFQMAGVALVDGSGWLLNQARTLYTLPSAAYTSAIPASPSNVFDTTFITYAAFDATITSFTGGTSPSIAFLLERQGADGAWYQILSTGGLTSAPSTVSVDISPGLNGSFSGPPSSTIQHNVFTNTARVRWTLGGSVAPTAVTFSLSVIGR